MKRSLALILVVMLSFAIPVAVLAEGIDYSVFEDVEGLKYSYDDMTDTHKVESTVGIVSLMVDQKAVVMPTIAGLNTDSIPDIVLLIQLVAIDPEGLIGLKSYIVKTDSNRYAGDLINVTDEANTSPYMQYGQIICGENALDMISDIISSGEVKVRFVGSQKDIDFIMSEAQINVMRIFYDAYIASGVTAQSFTLLNTLDSVEKQ